MTTETLPRAPGHLSKALTVAEDAVMYATANDSRANGVMRNGCVPPAWPPYVRESQRLWTSYTDESFPLAEIRALILSDGLDATESAIRAIGRASVTLTLDSLRRRLRGAD